MKNKKEYVTAIILAAGSGSRMGCGEPKQYARLCGESVLRRCVRAFDECDSIDAVVVVCREGDKELVRSELCKDFVKLSSVIEGGAFRAESAMRGFKAVPEATDIVAIHDAARCLVTPDMISRVVYDAIKYGAATAAAKVTDTIKQVCDGFVEKTVLRDRLMAAQTPQVFSRQIYAEALASVGEELSSVTDDNMLVERIGIKVHCTETGASNIKITTPEDIGMAEYIISRRQGMEQIRVGHGYDVHRLVPERSLILGGVDIPYERGLLGHSDADVLTHAIMDSLLGAAALGDIGRHFPDSSDEFRGISSLELLSRVKRLLVEAGYSVVNIDATVVLQKPKISRYIDRMIENIAGALGICPGSVNVKATTEEHLGFTGSGEGAAAYAVALVKNKG